MTVQGPENAPLPPMRGTTGNAPVLVSVTSGGMLPEMEPSEYPRPLVLFCDEQGFRVKDKTMLFYGEPVTDPHAGIDAALQKIRDKEYQRAASKPAVRKSEPTVTEFRPVRELPLGTRIARRFMVTRRRYQRWAKT